MEPTQTLETVVSQDPEIAELLQEVEKRAVRHESRWTEKRAHERRSIRTWCEVRFIAPDGEKVLYAVGKTREISAGGLSFLSREHFTRRASVLITLSVVAGRTRMLSARVVYSRSVREGWYLTGVQFRPAQDARLAPENYTRISATEAASARQVLVAEDDDKLSLRRRMLQALAMASIPSYRTKSLIAKVLVASMSSDCVVRRAAIPVLQCIGGDEAVVSLISMLRDCNSVIQGEAAEALGILRVRQASEPMQALLHHQDDEVAVRAAEALARMGDWSGKRVISRLIIHEGPASRRAARALGLLVGCDFRPNAEGVSQAREYLHRHDF